MAGYIGSKASVTSSGAERKKTFAITTNTTSLTGLSYTVNQVHVFHNGVRLVDGTDYTATNGTSITLTSAAENGDEVVVISYATFQPSDTVSASVGGTFAGDVNFTGNVSVDGGTIKLDGNYPVGTENVALGDTALDDASLSGSQNTAIGSASLTNNTSGTYNTAIGREALKYNTTGYWNVAIGRTAAIANTTGNYNIAIGANSLASNTTASNNTAVGYQAGYSNTTGRSNTFIGDAAGNASTSSFNTYIGKDAGKLITSGEGNTILGSYNGNQGGLDIRTSNNNIVLSDGDGNPRGFYNNAANGWVFGDGDASTYWPNTSSVNNHNGVMIFPITGALGVTTNQSTALYLNRNSTSSPDGNVAVFYRNGVLKGSISVSSSSTAYNTSSDYRLKENVVGLTGATDRLKQLNPSRFNFIADADTTVDGFIAHEVQSVVPEAITGTKDAVDADGNPEYQGIDQSKLVPLLVATIKELEARITALEAN